MTYQLDKSAWGDGPWQDEPDELGWQDQETGLPCAIIRAPITGSLCGYVGVPPGHPLFGWRYDDPLPMALAVHGEITWSGALPNQRDTTHHYFGFDCAHCDDYMPAMVAKLRQLSLIDDRFLPLAATTFSSFGETYRTIDFVKAECARLAKQLHAYEAS